MLTDQKSQRAAALAAFERPDQLIAYVKPIEAGDLPASVRQKAGFEKNIRLYAVSSWDGTPMTIADSMEAAQYIADHHDIELLSVH